jgi:hypothetical protein
LPTRLTAPSSFLTVTPSTRPFPRQVSAREDWKTCHDG